MIQHKLARLFYRIGLRSVPALWRDGEAVHALVGACAMMVAAGVRLVLFVTVFVWSALFVAMALSGCEGFHVAPPAVDAGPVLGSDAGAPRCLEWHERDNPEDVYCSRWAP